MSTVYYTLGMVLFFASILISIGLHELGHLIPAKAFGGKVTQYFIGFGPTVWSKQVGETEYGVKAIPLGGYVKIVGMLPPGAAQLADKVEGDEDGEQVVRIRKSNTGMFTQLISDARAAEWELVTPEDQGRLFFQMASWKKIVVMAAGPMVNIAIAFVLFWILFATHGQAGDPVVAAGPPVIDQVSACVVPYSENGRACTAADPKSPAEIAGLKAGDTITAFNGTAVTSYAQLSTLIRANAAGKAVIDYTRDGVAHQGTTNTTVQARPASGATTGETDPTLTQVGFLGIAPVQHTTVTHGGPIYTVQQMGGMTKDVVSALGTLPAKVWNVAEAIVGKAQRDPNGPESIVGGGRFAGEAFSAPDFPVKDKLFFLITIVGSFNFFIGMFNFVPLLPLDGGHIFSALWEAVRRGLARLRRRPDPGHVDAAKLLPIAYVVASCLLVMGVVLIVGDLVVPNHITG